MEETLMLIGMCSLIYFVFGYVVVQIIKMGKECFEGEE